MFPDKAYRYIYGLHCHPGLILKYLDHLSFDAGVYGGTGGEGALPPPPLRVGGGGG